MAQLQLPSLGLWEQKEDFFSQDDIVDALFESMGRGTWTETVRRVKSCVNRHTQLVISAFAVDSAKRLEAVGAASLRWIGRRRARLRKDRNRRRRHHRCGGSWAAGQEDGDVVAAEAGRAPGDRKAVRRPGVLG